jgi:hypothetical protein
MKPFRPPSTVYKPESNQRNKLFMGVGIIALLLVVSLIAFAALRERRSRREAEAHPSKSGSHGIPKDMLKGCGLQWLGEDKNAAPL